jgi:Zn-dependent alcohol dehydrogenase
VLFGHEYAGVVEAVGVSAGVRRSVGDEVVGANSAPWACA